ncbi:fumarylacetoacetase [Allonocardiopsis opalescens]|uniref:fumarylacetoacetase n=1 Tax=Allonocardiopsis opalescens TaxID=1144618 RepID=A0A2T0PZ27_9ACTN|nr:fumarylacetoacetase [Allonocardiopsis opalescens]PRX96793.1 fumarylacetoacetate hydrolase [Allonocardiopsis opalescens]
MTGAAATWVDVPEGSGFGPANLPYGVFAPSGGEPRVGVAIGGRVLDLAAALGDPVFAAPALNPFLAQGPARWREVRARVAELLGDERHRAWAEPHLHPLDGVALRLPFEVADYVDFYASEHHAANLGALFRPGQPPLTPNWKHLPIGYHGRAGTVVPSGTPVVRPCGQYRPDPDAPPVYGPTRRLDIEAEVGFVVGAPSKPGEPVPLSAFAEHVFGVCLVNDWSARDVQAWEYVPLGPFLGKSFATSVSPWVVPLAALAAARTAPPPREPAPPPYLRDGGEPWGLDLALEVRLNGHLVSRPPYAAMYWTPAQMLAHLTANGAALRTGDLFASGTVSGPGREQRGSLAELSWGGAEPLRLPGGAERTFLHDGDEVSITATAPGTDGSRIGFGEVTGRVLPARPPEG